MKIEIEEYSVAWPQMLAEEKARLESVIPYSINIEHIGSTAVPGLAAKPVIDIMLGLTDFAQADSLVRPIESLGYEYVSQFEDEMPYRRFFRKENCGVRTHHIHAVSVGSEFWIRHLRFRDYLRNRPDVAAEYACLKRSLAQQEWADMNEYAGAKTDFIQRIDALAAVKAVKP
ncbi:MAG TPA: GrpB family protein [Abditibacteriaceae bacterium]|jgi:GrpB-like predicted nucleotidyltransferase (UPF0157 family)